MPVDRTPGQWDAGSDDTDAAPSVDLVDPTPVSARRAVLAAVPSGVLDDRRRAGLELAISEVVTNAVVHGVPPVRVQAWVRADGCVVVTIRDAGPGPRRPRAPSLPAADAEGGRGMWICRRSVSHVDERIDGDGYVVRLIAGG